MSAVPPVKEAPEGQVSAPPSKEGSENSGLGSLESARVDVADIDSPEGARASAVERVEMRAHEQFAGPLPHPRHLSAYDEIVPGAADRILRMAEKDQDHRIGMEQSALVNDDRYRMIGMMIGAATFIALTGCAVALALVGNNLGAGLFLTATAIGAVATFVNGRRGDGT